MSHKKRHGQPQAAMKRSLMKPFSYFYLLLLSAAWIQRNEHMLRAPVLYAFVIASS